MSNKDAKKSAAAKARAKSLTPEQRKEIARKAAEARWNKDVPMATHIGELSIGDLDLACAVLPDSSRVLSQGGIGAAFGPATGGWQARKRKDDSGELPLFLVADSLQPFISKELRTLVSSPIRYKDPRGGPIRIGFSASLLPKLCEVWLKAREANALTKIQEPVAYRAEILMRGLAEVGIVALVDEATGYQRDRASDALAEILEAFIAKELQPWVYTFKDDFYENLFRLRGLSFPRDKVKRPQYFGHLTNDIVYKRLAPGILEELQTTVPRNKSGQRKHHFHRKLTPDIGHPKLREYLISVTGMMMACDDYNEFIRKLDKRYPRYNETLPLDLEFENDDGKGL
jgi:hypothetical protein